MQDLQLPGAAWGQGFGWMMLLLYQGWQQSMSCSILQVASGSPGPTQGMAFGASCDLSHTQHDGVNLTGLPGAQIFGQTSFWVHLWVFLGETDIESVD